MYKSVFNYAFRAEVKAMAINTKNMTTGGVGKGSVPVTATAMMDPHDTRCCTYKTVQHLFGICTPQFTAR